MAGLIESTQRRKNPYEPMVPLQGPNVPKTKGLIAGGMTPAEIPLPGGLAPEGTDAPTDGIALDPGETEAQPGGNFSGAIDQRNREQIGGTPIPNTTGAEAPPQPADPTGMFGSLQRDREQIGSTPQPAPTPEGNLSGAIGQFQRDREQLGSTGTPIPPGDTGNFTQIGTPTDTQNVGIISGIRGSQTGAPQPAPTPPPPGAENYLGSQTGALQNLRGDMSKPGAPVGDATQAGEQLMQGQSVSTGELTAQPMQAPGAQPAAAPKAVNTAETQAQPYTGTAEPGVAPKAVNTGEMSAQPMTAPGTSAPPAVNTATTQAQATSAPAEPPPGLTPSELRAWQQREADKQGNSLAGLAANIQDEEASGSQVWNPTDGIAGDIRQADTRTVTGTNYDPVAADPAVRAEGRGYDATTYTGTGYTAEKAPDAVGYEARGYDAKTVDENLSGAVNRIIGEDSVLMQRAKATADQGSNARGLLNSSMAIGSAQGAVLDRATDIGKGDVQVGMFNADAVNRSKEFLANWQNQSAQFLAAEKNQNGRFNAQQANDAAKFTAEATNRANEFAAAAQNAAAAFTAAAENNASMFNAGEANKMALFAADQATAAARFAAEADMAAKEFNATAYNQAMQRYTDSYNAALAAQNDAENLARRDTAQIRSNERMGLSQLASQQQIATTAAQGQAAMANAQLQMRGRELDAQMTQFGLQLAQQDRQFAQSLSAAQFNQFMQGLNAGMLTEMEPEARQNFFNNYMSIWSLTGSLPFDIDMTQFPPAGNTNSGTPPPPGNPVRR